MRTDTVRAKVSHLTKVGAEKVLKQLGLTMSEAINLMLVQVKLRQALPFGLYVTNQPNAETIKAMEDIENDKNLTAYTVDEFLSELRALNDDTKR